MMESEEYRDPLEICIQYTLRLPDETKIRVSMAHPLGKEPIFTFAMGRASTTIDTSINRLTLREIDDMIVRLIGRD